MYVEVSCMDTHIDTNIDTYIDTHIDIYIYISIYTYNVPYALYEGVVLNSCVRSLDLKNPRNMSTNS